MYHMMSKAIIMFSPEKKKTTRTKKERKKNKKNGQLYSMYCMMSKAIIRISQKKEKKRKTKSKKKKETRNGKKRKPILKTEPTCQNICYTSRRCFPLLLRPSTTRQVLLSCAKVALTHTFTRVPRLHLSTATTTASKISTNSLGSPASYQN